MRYRRLFRGPFTECKETRSAEHQASCPKSRAEAGDSFGGENVHHHAWRWRYEKGRGGAEQGRGSDGSRGGEGDDSQERGLAAAQPIDQAIERGASGRRIGQGYHGRESLTRPTSHADIGGIRR